VTDETFRQSLTGFEGHYVLFHNFSQSKKVHNKWGAFYLFIANFLATQNIGGTKELVVLL